MQQADRRIVHFPHHQAIFQFFRLACFDKFLLQLRGRNRLCRRKNQIAHRRFRIAQKRRSPVSVRFVRIRARPPRHQQLLEHAFFNRRNLCRPHALFVHRVAANQRRPLEFFRRWIVHDRHVRRQHSRSKPPHPIAFPADVAQELFHHWSKRYRRPRPIQVWPQRVDAGNDLDAAGIGGRTL